MKEANKGKEPPEFMSTHPSSTNRIKQINEWLNEIIFRGVDECAPNLQGYTAHVSVVIEGA